MRLVALALPLARIVPRYFSPASAAEAKIKQPKRILRISEFLICVSVKSTPSQRSPWIASQKSKSVRTNAVEPSSYVRTIRPVPFVVIASTCIYGIGVLLATDAVAIPQKELKPLTGKK